METTSNLVINQSRAGIKILGGNHSSDECIKMANEERFKNQISCAVPSDTSKRSGFNQQRQPLSDKSNSSSNTIRVQKKNKLVTAYTCSTESAKHTYMHQHIKNSTQPKKETVTSTCTKLEKVTQTIMSLWTILRRSGLVNMQSFRQELRKSVWNTSTSSTLDTCHSHTHMIDCCKLMLQNNAQDRK